MTANRLSAPIVACRPRLHRHPAADLALSQPPFLEQWPSCMESR